jgi:hypothetical protein
MQLTTSDPGVLDQMSLMTQLWRHSQPPRHNAGAGLATDGQGVALLDAGEIDVFEVDELIHHYKQSARELWKFCNLSGGGPVGAARALEFLREHGEDPPDWWAAGERRRRSR